MHWKRLTALLLAALMLLGLTACALDEEDAASLIEAIQVAAENIEDAPKESPLAEQLFPAAESPSDSGEDAPEETPVPPDLSLPEDPHGIGAEPVLDPDGWYTTKEDVALYLYTYGELPGNFITKSEARALGWSGGGLDGYADGKSIGGDRFGNYEGLLPDGDYHECDVNTMHASSRGAERIVYSADGRIYYTNDHYESFTLLYGEE